MVTPRASVFSVDWRIYPRQLVGQKVLGVDWRIYPNQLTVAGAVLERNYSVWIGGSIQSEIVQCGL